MDARLAIIENNYNIPNGTNNTEPSTSNQNTSLDKLKGIVISKPNEDDTEYIQMINKINYQKWYTKITLHIGNNFKINVRL